MKKIAAALFVLAIMGSTFTSCKKCMECKIYDEDGDLADETGELCGKQEELDEAKAEWQDAVDDFVEIGLDYELVCTDL